MAKSNAQRQAEYQARRRAQNLKGGAWDNRKLIHADLRLDIKFALDRLCSCDQLNQRLMLERLITEAEQQIMQNLNYDEQDLFIYSQLKRVSE